MRFSSWPSTMLTPTALMKPTMTAFDTKRRTPPSRRAPATTMTTPVNIARVKSALAGSGPSWTVGTSATMIAMAPVPWTAMKAEEVETAPATVPTMYP